MLLKRLRYFLEYHSETVKRIAIGLLVLSVLFLGCFSAQISQLDGLNGSLDPATLLEIQRLDRQEALKRLLDGVIEHQNPSFHFSTSLIPYADSRDDKFLGKLYLPPKQNDFIRFDFIIPANLSGLLIRTGNTENPRDLLDHNAKVYLQKTTSTQMINLGEFNKFGYIDIYLKEIFQVQSIQIMCQTNSDNGVVISEVLFRVVRDKFTFY